MINLRRTGLALALGAAAAVVLPAAAHADEVPTTTGTDASSADSTGGTAGTAGVSPASPLDLLLSTPGDVIGTLVSGSPV